MRTIKQFFLMFHIMLPDYFDYFPHFPFQDNLQPCPAPDMQTLQFVANATQLGNQSSEQGHYTIPVWDFPSCIFSNFCTAQVCRQMKVEVLRPFMSLLTEELLIAYGLYSTVNGLCRFFWGGNDLMSVSLSIAPLFLPIFAGEALELHNRKKLLVVPLLFCSYLSTGEIANGSSVQ